MPDVGFCSWGRRRIQPPETIAQQLTEACGWDEALRYLVRDRDRSYGEVFVRRTHLSLDKDAPISRAIEAVGRIIGRPVLGGLHHQYVQI